MGGALEKYVAVAAIAALKIVAMTGRMIANFFQRSVSLSKGPAGILAFQPARDAEILEFLRHRPVHEISYLAHLSVRASDPQRHVEHLAVIFRYRVDDVDQAARIPAIAPRLGRLDGDSSGVCKGIEFQAARTRSASLAQQPALGRPLDALDRPTERRPLADRQGHDRSCCVQSRRSRHHPAASCGTGFTRGKQAAFSLVQEWRKRTEASRDRAGIDHAPRVDEPASTSLRIMDPFVASLPPCRFFPSDSVAQAQALSAVSTDAPVRVIMMKRAASSAVALSAECCQQPRGRLLGSLTRPVAATLRHPRADFDKSASTTSIKVDQSDVSALAIFHIAP